MASPRADAAIQHPDEVRNPGRVSTTENSPLHTNCIKSKPVPNRIKGRRLASAEADQRNYTARTDVRQFGLDIYAQEGMVCRVSFGGQIIHGAPTQVITESKLLINVTPCIFS